MTSDLRSAWFALGNAGPRSSTGNLADLHAHRQERLQEFLSGTWEAAAALMLCTMKHYIFYLLLRLALHRHWANASDEW